MNEQLDQIITQKLRSDSDIYLTKNRLKIIFERILMRKVPVETEKIRFSFCCCRQWTTKLLILS